MIRIRREPDPRQADLFAAALAASAYISAVPMKRLTFPAGAVPADPPQRISVQTVTSTTEPPDGLGWLHEIKHDGHRLVAIIAEGDVKLLSRNARDRSELFAEPFHRLAAAGLPAMVLDGEIAVPDASLSASMWVTPRSILRTATSFTSGASSQGEFSLRECATATLSALGRRGLHCRQIGMYPLGRKD